MWDLSDLGNWVLILCLYIMCHHCILLIGKWGACSGNDVDTGLGRELNNLYYTWCMDVRPHSWAWEVLKAQEIRNLFFFYSRKLALIQSILVYDQTESWRDESICDSTVLKSLISCEAFSKYDEPLYNIIGPELSCLIYTVPVNNCINTINQFYTDIGNSRFTVSQA